MNRLPGVAGCRRSQAAYGARGLRAALEASPRPRHALPPPTPRLPLALQQVQACLRQRRRRRQLAVHLAALVVHTTVQRVAHHAACSTPARQAGRGRQVVGRQRCEGSRGGARQAACARLGLGCAEAPPAARLSRPLPVVCMPGLLLSGHLHRWQGRGREGKPCPPGPHPPSDTCLPPPPPQCRQRRTSWAYCRSRRFHREESTAAASCGCAVQQSHSGLVAWVRPSHTAQWRDR